MPGGSPARRVVALAVATVLALSWVVLRLSGAHFSAIWEVLLSGAAIFGAAFLLSWGAEVAQLEIPQALAIGFLALVAVLPEYAVDVYFAWEAGKDPSYTAYAMANMTGANRLLIGVGWASVVFAVWLKTGTRVVKISQDRRVELRFLLIATVYAFFLPYKATLSVWDAVVLVSLFVLYVISAARSDVVEPELEGVSETLATLPLALRRVVTCAIFLVAGVAILAAAEPFAEGLLATGRQFGIEEFLLVQWLAPLASEAPEFIVAILFALRGNATLAMGTLIASKVNQWTVLVGMLPLVYAVSAGQWHDPMHLDARQAHEILLTAAQSLFAVIILIDFRISVWEALALLVLFGAQLAFPDPTVRIFFSGLYVVLAGVLLLLRPGARRSLLRLFGPRAPWQPVEKQDT